MLQADYLHQPCYCEENVYHLIQRLSTEGRWAQAVFISNAARMCPFWRHKAGSGTAGLVVWDYHVLCMEQPPQGPALIWDLDRQDLCARQHLHQTLSLSPFQEGCCGSAVCLRARPV